MFFKANIAHFTCNDVVARHDVAPCPMVVCPVGHVSEAMVKRLFSIFIIPFGQFSDGGAA